MIAISGGCPDLFGHWLAIGPKAGDVHLDGFGGPLAALLKGASTGETAGQRRDVT